MSLISDEELKLERELMSLSNLASTPAGEQLVVRLEAASLARDEGGSRCKVEAGGLVDQHKEEQEGGELHVSWSSLSIRGDPHSVRMYQSQPVDHCSAALRSDYFYNYFTIGMVRFHFNFGF